MKVVMGGSFDPVHIGHLRLATELAELLGTPVSLMPCKQAVHKGAQGASASDRLAMLRLSIDDNPLLDLDNRELNRKSDSYTVYSLQEIRAQMQDEPLIFVLGTDSAVTLKSWKEAEEFSRLANFLILERPQEGSEPSARVVDDELEVLGFAKSQSLEGLLSSPSGQYFELCLSMLAISSSYIRTLASQKRSLRYIVPDAVERYICDNNLYTHVSE